MLSAFLPLLLATSSAEAATITVPDDVPTIQEAVDAAVSGDTVLVRPGYYVLTAPVRINKNLTIRGEVPPREVDDVDVLDDVLLAIDILGVTLNPGFEGAFVVGSGSNNVQLTFENIRFKLPETFCDDDRDEDGNGLADDADPLCSAGEDTGVAPVLIGPYSLDLRAFLVRRNARLTVLNSEFQGFSIATDGNVILAQNAASVIVRGSRFVSNRMPFEIAPNGDLTRSRGGAIQAIGVANFELTGNTFWANEARFGGAVYALDGANLVATDNVFYENRGEDGGALFIESARLDASRNVFVSNDATLVPGVQLYVTYEGGALYAEDSDITLRNNLFFQNGSLDWGAAVMLRRNAGGVQPLLENNTFVANEPAPIGGASVMVESTQFRYRNNISYLENRGVLGAQEWPLGTVPIVEYNDFYSGGSPIHQVFAGDLASLRVNSAVNINADPLFDYFIPEEHDDWRLWRFWLDPASPCVDAGDPGMIDIGGSRVDMGAYGGEFSGAEDADGDGWVNIYDCDDSDPSKRPYGVEICDDEDNDCNGIVDDDERTYYVDRDFDGYGDRFDVLGTEALCPGETPTPIPAGQGAWVLQAGDETVNGCDPRNAQISPGRAEVCDDIDNDCDGLVDAQDDLPTRTYFPDFDGDGFGTQSRGGILPVEGLCPPNEFFSPFNDDCDDDNADIHPLITVERQIHAPLALQPVERNEADRSPAFVANGRDEDCNLVDLCYPDFDQDRYGAAPNRLGIQTYIDDNDLSCGSGGGFNARNNLDCDDTRADANPRGIEVPGDGIDQDCNGIDICYQDLDGDGFGSDATIEADEEGCGAPESATADNNLDCDDTSARAADLYPGQIEVCDGFDNNCDGTIDEVTSPDAEQFYLDADGDGFGLATSVIKACGEPIGYSRISGDCNDDSPLANPDEPEVCDGLDNNCAGGVDEASAVDAQLWYRDNDGDGFGTAAIVEKSCEAPEGAWVPAGTGFDCDDNDPIVGRCGCDCSSTGALDREVLPLAALLLGAAGVRRRRSRAV